MIRGVDSCLVGPGRPDLIDARPSTRVVNAPPLVHFLFEALAYAIGGRLYLRARAPHQPVVIATLVGAALGAALGSKVLYWLEWPSDTVAHLGDPAWLLGGKSIVGGLLGGWLGVEMAKARTGERRSTGDAFVLPLIVGMSVGRVGCFLAGLSDHTVGVVTTLPWGVDFGDGKLRHPTQLYEIAGLLIALWPLMQIRVPSGARFRWFLLLYLGLRFGLDMLKPDPRWLFGLTAIQGACIAGSVVAGLSLVRLAKASPSLVSRA